jgi:hypothetical protein
MRAHVWRNLRPRERESAESWCVVLSGPFIGCGQSGVGCLSIHGQMARAVWRITEIASWDLYGLVPAAQVLGWVVDCFPRNLTPNQRAKNCQGGTIGTWGVHIRGQVWQVCSLVGVFGGNGWGAMGLGIESIAVQFRV